MLLVWNYEYRYFLNGALSGVALATLKHTNYFFFRFLYQKITWTAFYLSNVNQSITGLISIRLLPFVLQRKSAKRNALLISFNVYEFWKLLSDRTYFSIWHKVNVFHANFKQSLKWPVLGGRNISNGSENNSLFR